MKNWHRALITFGMIILGGIIYLSTDYIFLLIFGPQEVSISRYYVILIFAIIAMNKIEIRKQLIIVFLTSFLVAILMNIIFNVLKILNWLLVYVNKLDQNDLSANTSSHRPIGVFAFAWSLDLYELLSLPV